MTADAAATGSPAGPDGAGQNEAGPDEAGPDGAGQNEAGQNEVDRIVAAWHRVRPDLDASPLEVLSRISRLARHLDRYRAAAFAGSDLEPWEFDVLAALRRAGAPYEMSPRQLITQTMVTSGTMTNRIDRLEARALVHRRPDPDDGRGVLVRLTAAGARLVDGALEGLLAQERGLLAELGAAEREELADLLRRLVAPFDAG
jgi:DNA-binding MarR family transcriptional regulator